MTVTLELRDKLDAMTTAMVDADTVVRVNGPEGVDLDWDAIDWRAHEDNVKRLRQRIFKAVCDGDLKKVRSLQKLMLRSLSNTLVSVRQVTQRNTGRNTAGIDGEVALTSQARAALAMQLHRSPPTQARPVRRVYIPKANGKQRPLGIPVLADRVQQARVKQALEPEWEARFEPRSYGFRPGRGCHDAIEMIYKTLRGDAQRRWILDADLSAAFDRIDHDSLVAQLGSFPGRDMIRRWLKAGIVERDTFAPTIEGTPQGGVISPLLLNVALHGMEQAAGVRYRNLASNKVETTIGSPVLVRYADDFVAMCYSRDQAEEVKSRLMAWLDPKGLTFNEDKTRIVDVEVGFSFLGFNVRRYISRYGGAKLLIKPSDESVQRIRKRLAAEMRSLRGTNAAAVIGTLNPIIRGWAAYYRNGVSSRIFGDLDNHMWCLTYKWARRSHPTKSRSWVTTHYFDRFHRSRQDRWVFGDRTSGHHLQKFAWTRIVRHVPVKGKASPDDPTLTDYWTQRHRKRRPPLDPRTLRLLWVQQGRCAICRHDLLPAEEPQTPQQWEQWFITVRHSLRTDSGRDNDGTAQAADPRLVHRRCQQHKDGPVTLRGHAPPTRLA